MNKPVAWMDEHENVIFEKNWAYPIPLYTHPVKELTQSEFENIFDACYIGDDYDTQYDFKQMLKLINQAILRKAQEK